MVDAHPAKLHKEAPAPEHPVEHVPHHDHAHEPAKHSHEERRILFILTVAFVASIVFIPIIAVISESPAINVLFGLSPLLATLALSLTATSKHYKIATLWIILLVIHFFGLGLLYFINLALDPQLSVSSSVSTSLLISIIILLVCSLSTIREEKARKYHHVVEFRPEKLHEYVQSIEDKCKAINFVVGRTYRSSNGATSKMRERLRIPSEWYNEFHSIKLDEIKQHKEKAMVLMQKIRDKLGLYSKKEKDIFTIQEIAALKHLARHKDGEDTIITVLKTNDRDPVEHYYVSAVDFCDRILEELKKEKSE